MRQVINIRAEEKYMRMKGKITLVSKGLMLNEAENVKHVLLKAIVDALHKLPYVDFNLDNITF